MTVTGDKKDYTFTWTPAVSTSNTATGLAAGTYKVSIAKAANPVCAEEFTFTVKQIACPVNCVKPTLDAQKVTDASCGSKNGAVELTVNGGNANFTYAWSSAATSSSATGLDAGTYTVTVSRVADATCFSVFTFTVKAVGDLGIFANTTDTRDISDCAAAAYTSYCLPISIADITAAKYDITDNGTLITSGFKGCDFDSTFMYNYAILPDNAPHKLTSWSVNGVNNTTDFSTLSELVAKMNTWDVTGNWKLNTTAKSINGGDRKKFYTPLVIKSANGTVTTLDLNTQLVPQGVAIKLNVGTHVIKVVAKATGCADEISVKVTCTQQPVTCKSFIADKDRYVYATTKGVKGSTCLEIPYANLADYTITDNNAPYTGKTEACTAGTSFEMECGIHEMIFKTKDGCRDTILLKVACVSAKQIVDTIYVTQADTACLDVTELLGKIKDISNVAPTKSGEHVAFKLVPNSRCVTYKGIEAGGTDEAVYVMQDDKGISDTTFFKITVIARVAQIVPAVAVGDNATTKQNEAIVINLLANDTLRSAITTIEIAEQPLHGSVEILQNGIATYTPNKGFCGGNGDQFTYRVCTVGGCDTARVTVKVICNDINVFTGFSPNGDNVNDFFTIDGIQEYPDNKLNVFDRQGNSVFEQKGYRNDWNGTWKGKNLPDGTYFYLFNNGKGETKAGYVQIQR